MLRRLTACLVGALLLGGCGGGGDGDAGETATTATGLTNYEVGSAHFEIAVPQAWKAADAERVVASDEFEAAVAEAPTLKPYLDALREPQGLLKFVAFDPNVRKGFATNANVVVEPLAAGMTAEKYERTTLEQLELVPVVLGEIEHEKVELPAGDALKIRYRLKLAAAGGTKVVSTLQYVVVAARAAYILTYSALPELAGEYAQTFADSAEGFRLTESG